MNNPTESLVWKSGDSENRFDLASLPVVIGTTSAADIRLAGPGGQTLAQIDSLQGQLFLQPLLRPSPISVNAAPVSGNVFLEAGNSLEVFGLKISVTQEGDSLVLNQDSSGGAFATQPPEVTTGAEQDELVAAEWQPHVASAPEKKPSKLLPAIGVSTLVLLGAVVWWLTTAVSLRFDTLPTTPDQVVIDGPGFAVPVAGRWLLRPGVHTVRLRSQGYQDLTTNIDVDASLGVVVLEQIPLPGSVLVSGNGAGTARLTNTAGDQFETDLPAVFEGLMPGRYDVAVSAEGFLDWSDEIAVKGRGVTQTLDVQLVRNSARVSVPTTPAGAGVYSADDGELLAEGNPTIVELAEGRHDVVFRLDGYKPVRRTYVVFANTDVEAAPLTFEPADAVLTVSSVPAAASVTLNGQYQGVTPLQLALEADKNYQLRLTRTGYGSVSRNVRLPSASREALNLRLSAQIGEVTVRTVPTDAKVFINGREQGSGTVVVNLPAEPQRIRVSKPGYVDFETRITPRPGFSQTVDARLKTPEQIRLSKIDQEITVFNEHKMRYIRPGTFRRGSSRREPDRRSNEALRDVRLTRPFYAAIHEVTNKQFAAFRRNHDSRSDVYPALAGDRNPVVNVTWQDAAAYCNWLSEKENLTPAYVGEFGSLAAVDEPVDGYRLPTEAEWVWLARYAGREGSARRFGWGAAMPPPEKTANFADDSAASLLSNILKGYKDAFPASSPVGSFRANAAGIYDLDGNVAEWVQDIYEINPSVEGPLIDYSGPQSGGENTIRGASWRSANVSALRLAYREGGADARDDLGFRIVRNAQ
ncbi:MAG: PEGA domain-containing protein [Pseudomonadota bacterium]